MLILPLEENWNVFGVSILKTKIKVGIQYLLLNHKQFKFT